jgi:xylulokinase
MGISIPVISINGGGAKSRLWCEIIANVLNVKVVKLNANEGPAYGAAILAAVGSGLFPTVEAACGSFIRVSESIEPDKEKTELYNSKYGKFKQIYPATKELFRRLAEVNK